MSNPAKSNPLSASSNNNQTLQSQTEDQKIINDEYKIWKKNTPFLYDVMLSHALEWPSLTVSWFNDVESFGDRVDGEGYAIHKLLIGTHAPHNEPNYIHIIETRLPNEQAEFDVTNNNNNPLSFGFVRGQMDIVQSIRHEGEVNRARVNSSPSNLIATKSSGPDVLLFDTNNHPAKPNKGSLSAPDYRLVGHEKEGFGLAWNPYDKNLILSGSEDRTICLWDITSLPTRSSSNNNNAGSSNNINPLHRYLNGHSDIVEDVAWSPNPSTFIFASCGDDKLICIWDQRVGSRNGPIKKLEAHSAEVNSVCFCPDPSTSDLLISGSSDKTLALWDLRSSNRLHSFESHKDAVLSVAWSPFSKSIFASCSTDRRVHLWDTANIGIEQDPEDAVDGPPELLFIHGGHTDKVGDIAWNPTNPFTLASVADDNILQVWEVAHNIVSRDDDVPSVPLAAST